MDDFLIRAYLGGGAFALMCGPVGSLLVWRRMAYFGNAVSHAALLGVALGLFLDVSLPLAVLGVTVLASLALLALERRGGLGADTALGLIAHASLAAGLVALAAMPYVRTDLTAYLFGDILALARSDLALAFGLGAGVLALTALSWRALLAASVHEELAAVEGVRVARQRLVFTLLIALVVAVGMQIVGVLLVVSLLIIPPAASRILARSPEAMAAGASLIGLAATGLGLELSRALDSPAGPSIVLAATALFLVLLAGQGIAGAVSALRRAEGDDRIRGPQG